MLGECGALKDALSPMVSKTVGNLSNALSQCVPKSVCWIVCSLLISDLIDDAQKMVSLNINGLRDSLRTDTTGVFTVASKALLNCCGLKAMIDAHTLHGKR